MDEFARINEQKLQEPFNFKKALIWTSTHKMLMHSKDKSQTPTHKPYNFFHQIQWLKTWTSYNLTLSYDNNFTPSIRWIFDKNQSHKNKQSIIFASSWPLPLWILMFSTTVYWLGVLVKSSIFSNHPQTISMHYQANIIDHN